MNRSIKPIIGVLMVMTLCVAGYFLYDHGRPAPVPVRKTLYSGVIYRRLVKVYPHPMIAHVIEIDRKITDAVFLVTPPGRDGELPLNARTTSQFLDEFNLQIAVNGDGFEPWWSRSPVDYYPRPGDPVKPLGLTAYEGDIYVSGRTDIIGTEPTLYVSRRNDLSFNNRPSRVWTAISGDRMLVTKGAVEDGLDDTAIEPRSAIGISQNGRYLYLVVVDGRQPFYSDGATFSELGDLLVGQGAYIAMSLDGGGSSTMVIEGDDGETIILNSPIDNYIPGRERPVANHFGVYVR